MFSLVKKQNEALLILERLKKGESFTNLANVDKWRECKESWELGLFARGIMIKPFEEAAPKLKKAEITSEPVKTELEYPHN